MESSHKYLYAMQVTCEKNGFYNQFNPLLYYERVEFSLMNKTVLVAGSRLSLPHIPVVVIVYDLSLCTY